MMYLVFMVPTLATWASCVDGVLNNAAQMWVFAVSVRRYQPKVFLLLLSLSLRSTNNRWVLMQMQFWSLAG